MELAQLERIFQRSAPRVWEFLAPVDDRIPQQFRPLVEQFLSRLYAGVAEWLTSDNQLSSDTSEELTALGLAMSRALAWDVIDEINKSWVQTVIESSVDMGDIDLGSIARAAISVSDTFYDGFWVYNNREGYEQALRLGSLIDHFPIPTFMLDKFGAITFANDMMCAVLDCTPGDLDARKLEDFLVSGTSIFSAAESFVTIPRETSETRHYKLTLTRIDNSEGTEFFGQLVDRTDEVNLERTKEQIIATISHELRTPLTAVVGYAELLRESEPSDGIDREEATGVIFEQAQHLLELVTDLVDFARLDTGRIDLKSTDVDLRDVIDSVVRRVGVGQDVRLEIGIPHGIQLWVDRVRIEQLVTNLITNALRYGGPLIAIDAWSVDHATTVMRIADDGAGIPPADRAHAFESFYQGGQTHVGIGTGMGLAICKAIVRAHDGTIVLEDRPGASFLIELPAAP